MSEEKNSESIMVRVTPSLMQRVGTIAQASGLKPATLARMGLVEVVDRLSVQAAQIAPGDAKAVTAARARGLDVEKVLTEALEADCEKAAAGFQPGQVGLPAAL